jgi:alpha-1,3-rhamnosyl/mannosyltransferase
VKLVWAGRPAPGRIDAIRRLARELGQADAFVELGHVADHDLTALYRRAACLLFVSRCEGFGYPLVEAMASGCPVIASGTSSLAEVAGDAAVTVDPEAPAAIADAMRLLLDDPAERQRFVAAGAERARSFSVASMARATIQIYDQLLR